MTTDALGILAQTLRRGADQLADAAARVDGLDPLGHAFGADGPGVLGEVAAQIYGQWVAALAARVSENRSHGSRLAELATLVERASVGYADADDSAHHHHDHHSSGG